jgi:hypothetical protein
MRTKLWIFEPNAFRLAESSNGLSTFKLKYVIPAKPIVTDDYEDGTNVDENPPNPQPNVQPNGNFPRPNQELNQFQTDNSVCGIPVAGFTQSLVMNNGGKGCDSFE